MEDAAHYAKMKVADLKKELKTRGLAVTGNKNELVERLLAAEGHAPLASVEGDEEEFDEEEILGGGDMDSSEIKISPQEEEAALSGANLKVKKTLKTPAKREAPKIVAKKAGAAAADAGKSPTKKPITAVSDTKEQENIEPPKKVTKVDGEKSSLEKRAERFGVPLTEAAKKEARAARFGELTNGTVKGSSKLSTVTGGIDMDKLKARAERFGVVTSKSLTKAEETEKKKTRLERFGSAPEKTEEKTSDAAPVDAAKAARAARFAAAEKPKAETETPAAAK
ncbi:SAP domain-containing ribonucleoprotein isoform X2 [Palaemon carinicauda]|uniref:SAP domain-containing ribonucleoprotein isoform X2 n=1 Tax=Palaemon carinicauda TaxID=392227 RepID=UPI0035B609AC